MVQEAGGILPLLAAIALAFGVWLYVCLDGADLGVGILYALIRDPDDREVLDYSILPVWDGNETWLVLVGGGTMALFPKAFSILLTAFYLPLILMLMALAIRGTSLEFRGMANEAQKRRWDAAFCAGSLIAAFAQGVVAGAFLHGFVAGHDAYGDGWSNWVNPFALASGVVTVLGYTTLGAAWLIYRTKRELQQRARKHALLFGSLAAAGLIALAAHTPMLNPHYVTRWSTLPGPIYIGIMGFVAILAAVVFAMSICNGWERVPLGAALVLFSLLFLAAWFTVYPLIVPPSITLDMARAPRMTQLFVLCNYAIAVPLIIAYNTFSFYIFRGKIRSPAEHKAQ